MYKSKCTLVIIWNGLQLSTPSPRPPVHSASLPFPFLPFLAIPIVIIHTNTTLLTTSSHVVTDGTDSTDIFEYVPGTVCNCSMLYSCVKKEIAAVYN